MADEIAALVVKHQLQELEIKIKCELLEQKKNALSEELATVKGKCEILKASINENVVREKQMHSTIAHLDSCNRAIRDYNSLLKTTINIKEEKNYDVCKQYETLLAKHYKIDKQQREIYETLPLAVERLSEKLKLNKLKIQLLQAKHEVMQQKKRNDFFSQLQHKSFQATIVEFATMMLVSKKLFEQKQSLIHQKDVVAAEVNKLTERVTEHKFLYANQETCLPVNQICKPPSLLDKYRNAIKTSSNSSTVTKEIIDDLKRLPYREPPQLQSPFKLVLRSLEPNFGEQKELTEIENCATSCTQFRRPDTLLVNPKICENTSKIVGVAKDKKYATDPVSTHHQGPNLPLPSVQPKWKVEKRLTPIQECYGPSSNHNENEQPEFWSPPQKKQKQTNIQTRILDVQVLKNPLNLNEIFCEKEKSTNTGEEGSVQNMRSSSQKKINTESLSQNSTEDNRSLSVSPETQFDKESDFSEKYPDDLKNKSMAVDSPDNISEGKDFPLSMAGTTTPLRIGTEIDFEAPYMGESQLNNEYSFSESPVLSKSNFGPYDADPEVGVDNDMPAFSALFQPASKKKETSGYFYTGPNKKSNTFAKMF